jgi:uncharacterized protein (UPF0335 family)
MSPDDLTVADREIAQDALVRIYVARLERLEWDRQYLRDRVTNIKRARIRRLSKFYTKTAR